MMWLRAEMDGQDKSLVSMLWCLVCQHYELEYVDTKVSPGHGLMTQATINEQHY